MKPESIAMLAAVVVAGLVGYFVGASRLPAPPSTNFTTSTSTAETLEANQEHLPASTIDLPEEFKLRSQNGMAVMVSETDETTDILFLFYGEKHVSGAVRLTRILMRFPYHGNVYSTSTADGIYYDNSLVPDKRLTCLNGHVILDRDNGRLEVAFVVQDKTGWHRLGWNGVWKIDTDSTFNTDEIMQSMSVAD